jgi:hypothetical protein
MVVRDILNTVLTKSISQGKHKIAGWADGSSDIINIILNAGSGVHLIGMGWRGWVGIIPIGVTGKITTEKASKWSSEKL